MRNQHHKIRLCSLTLVIVAAVLMFSACANCRQQAKGEITVARVPDSNFRTYLLENNYVMPYAHPSRHRSHAEEWVEITPLGRATQLIDCHKKNIQSLDGIEFFPNLVILICGETPSSGST